MKKKFILTVIIAVIILSSMTVIAFAVANEISNKNSDNNTIVLEDYWSEQQQSRTTQSSSLSLAEIYAKCEALAKSGKKIVFEENLFTEHYSKLRYNEGNSLVASESSFSIESKDTANIEKDTYMLFIASVTTCFEDNIYYRDHDYDTKNYNRQRDSMFFYSADFSNYGYSSAEEYYKAACEGECEWSDESYYISFEDYNIYLTRSGVSERLYDAIKTGTVEK